jgi:hypothetical protein
MELHNFLFFEGIGINKIDFAIRTAHQYFFTSTNILGICYILYFESVVVFDRRIVEEKEF